MIKLFFLILWNSINYIILSNPSSKLILYNDNGILSIIGLKFFIDYKIRF